MAYRLLDLSQPLQPGAVTFPGDPPVEIEGPYSAVPGPDREYCYRLHLSSQAGTHIQGPHYFLPDGRPLAAFALERCCGDALVLDVRGRSLIGPADMAPLEGRKLAGRAILLLTGYTARLLAAPPADLEALLAGKPGLTLAGAQWLVAQGAQLIGVDSVGLEPGGSCGYSINRLLCRHEVLIVEGLLGLELLPAQGAWFAALPLPIPTVEGTPCRAVAWLPID